MRLVSLEIEWESSRLRYNMRKQSLPQEGASMGHRGINYAPRNNRIASFLVHCQDRQNRFTNNRDSRMWTLIRRRQCAPPTDHYFTIRIFSTLSFLTQVPPTDLETFFRRFPREAFFSQCRCDLLYITPLRTDRACESP